MQKICKISWKSFEITKKDLEFYKKMWVPTPTLCPEERQRRRLVWQNMSNLYHRTCNATSKKIISNFSSDKKYNIYEQKFWWSDKWDFQDFWQDFDFSKWFFKQWWNLLKNAPIPCLFTEFAKDENSAFTNFAGYDKNCYLVFHADFNEDCYFATWLKNSKNAVDSLNVFDTENSYQCIDCKDSFDIKYCQDVYNCSKSWFLRNCTWCKNCFWSMNLENKEYYLFNENVWKEKYEKFISEFESGKYNIMELAHKKMEEFQKKQIHKSVYSQRNENCEWDHLFDCFEVSESFDVKESRNMKFCERIYNWPNSDCYDVDQFWAKISRIYETSVVWLNCENVKFCITSYNVINVSYSAFCFNCEECFWCVWLKSQKYCIFNKQYSKEDYFILKEKIIEKMKKTWEYWEFFPKELSPWGYNETVANEYYFLEKEEILNLGFKYKEDEEKTLYSWPKYFIENDIKNVENDILKNILECKCCEKNYRIVWPELTFYKKQNLPIPRNCPNCRHLERMKLRNPRKLFDRNCDKCEKEIKSTFDKNREEKIYCEECYLEEIL